MMRQRCGWRNGERVRQLPGRPCGAGGGFRSAPAASGTDRIIAPGEAAGPA